MQRKQCCQHRCKAGQRLRSNLSAADVLTIRELAVTIYVKLKCSRIDPKLTADVVREG